MHKLSKQPSVVLSKNHGLISSHIQEVDMNKAIYKCFCFEKIFPNIWYSEHWVVDSQKLTFTSNYYKILNKTAQWFCRHNTMISEEVGERIGGALWGIKCLVWARHFPKHCGGRINGGVRSCYLIKEADT